MTDSKDELGDRMKGYELEAERIVPKGTPIVVRLDGHGFSKFTKGMRRPYDINMSNVMIDTTKNLMAHMGARIGYVQSDEITLMWYLGEDDAGEYPFKGRMTKITTLAAGRASSFFHAACQFWLPEKFRTGFHDPIEISDDPHFDCREVAVPDLTEAANCFRWRQFDARKNAVSMAAQATFLNTKVAARELKGMSQDEMLELMSTKGVLFEKYPYFFKRGSFVHRQREMVQLRKEELEQIPEKHRPTGPIERTFMIARDIPLVSKLPVPAYEVLLDPESFRVDFDTVYKLEGK